MKTTFYKKLVPLAMIASLALSGAGSAVAGTGFLTYSGNSIVAFADDENTEVAEAEVPTPAVDLAISDVATSATGKFDFFDADDVVRTIKIGCTIEENYKKHVQSTDEVDLWKIQDGVPSSMNGKKTILAYEDKNNKNAIVWIYNNCICTQNPDEGGRWEYTVGASLISGDETLESKGYVPYKGKDDDDTRTLDGTDENGDPSSKVGDIKVTDFYLKGTDNKAVAGMKVAAVEHQMKLKADYVAVEGKEPAASDYESDGDKYVLTIDVPASVEISSFDLYYGKTNVGSISYTRSFEAVETTLNDAGDTIKEYTGDAKNIDLGKATGVTTVGKEAFKGKGINNVIVGSNITTISEDAFKDCSALDTVTIKSDAKLTSVVKDAFPANAVVILENGVDAAVKKVLEDANANVFDAKTAVPGKMVLSAGDTVKFNCMNNSIISTGSDKQTATLTFNSTTPAEGETAKKYTFGTPKTDEEQIPSTYKWVVATTAGKVSSAAKINKKPQLAGVTKFDITGTKANGKFNNTVVLMAVPTSLKSGYNIDKAYAYCTFYIKPAAVTEWAKPKTSSAFVAAKDDDPNSPIQATDANNKKLWVKSSKAGGNLDADEISTLPAWNNVTDIDWNAVLSYETTTVETEAWTLADNTKVVIPATKGSEIQYNQVDSETSYDLTITEGQSFALPIKAKNGADKTLKYEVTDGSGNFTVVNGKVKGITAGEGTIVVTPVADHTVDSAIVNVHVTPKVSKGVTNTTSLTLVGTDAQSFRIGANPVSSKALYYTITENEALTITPDSEAETVEGVKYYPLTNGAAEISVKQTKATEGLGSAKASLDIQYYTAADATATIGKKFTVKVSESKTGEYDNVKKFKESAGKLDKANGVRKLAVPVGVTTYLGLSVTPATANQNFDIEVSGEGDYSIVGDAFTANEAGTYYVTATSVGIGADEKQVTATPYEITVYEQGGSIVFNDVAAKVADESAPAGFDVVGGYLIRKANAVTDGEHTFKPGEELAFTAPTNDAEDITWTSNNPAGLSVDVTGDKMTVVGTQPGTYTVTGKSEKTAQKYTFKVIIDKCNTCEAESPTISINSDVTEDLEKGQTAQLTLNVPEGLAGTVKWETADKTVATVSGKGLVKIVNKENKTGTCVIKATMTLNDKTGKKVKDSTKTAEFTVSVKPSTVTVTPKPVPAAAKVGTPFKVSATVKNGKVTDTAFAWKYRKAGTSDALATLTVDGSKATIAAAGEYDIYATYGTVEEYAGTVVVSAVTPSSLTVVDGQMNGLSINDLKNKKVGLQNYDTPAEGTKDAQHEAVVYVKAKTDKDDTAADIDDIIWTSSNANAVVATSTQGKGNAQYATVTVKVVDGTKYTGKVTLTGVSKNGGKKVSFTVMVNNGATAEAQKVTSATTKATSAPTSSDAPSSSN